MNPSIVFAQRYQPAGVAATLGDPGYRSRPREWFAACCDCGRVWPYTTEQAARAIGAQPHLCTTAPPTSEQIDATITEMRNRGATWATIGAVVGLSDSSAAARGRKLGLRKRVPRTMKIRAPRAEYMTRRRSEGATWTAIAAELGIATTTAIGWAKRNCPDLLTRAAA